MLNKSLAKRGLLRISQLVSAAVFVSITAQLAFATTSQCFRDIRKDNSPPIPVIHDFGCPVVVCDGGVAGDGICQPAAVTVGGVNFYACVCDRLLANNPSAYACLFAYKDTAGTGQGGTGGEPACLHSVEHCPPPDKRCVDKGSWVDIGDPDVPQYQPKCVCEDA